MSTPAASGPSSIVNRVAPWKSAFARLTSASSSPSSSGTITFWAVKYGAVERAEERRRPQQDRAEGDHVRPSGAAGSRGSAAPGAASQSDHRRPGAEAGDEHGARGCARARRGRSAPRRRHDAHARRGAGGDEHEPRQREPRHLRPGRRDDLGREQGDDRSPAEQRSLGQTSHSPSRCTGSPSSSMRVPGRRRSLTMSQWIRETFVPPRSGSPFPSARWTVPSIFSSKSVLRM